MSIKKIIVSTTAIILLLVIYLIPSNRKDIDLKNSIEYNYNNVESTIYLVDSNDYVARTTIPTCKCEGVDLAKDLLEGLVVGGTKNNIIPNGFRSIIPPDVTIKDINLQENILTINFSKELLEVNDKDEDKMIESIIYTLTSIDGIDKADTYSARAGYSEHQLGLAVDIVNGKWEYLSEKDKEYNWLINNSYKYGYILRYPRGSEYITGYVFEDWHFRYLGTDLATKVYNSNLTYDEYIARDMLKEK